MSIDAIETEHARSTSDIDETPTKPPCGDATANGTPRSKEFPTETDGTTAIQTTEYESRTAAIATSKNIIIVTTAVADITSTKVAGTTTQGATGTIRTAATTGTTMFG